MDVPTGGKLQSGHHVNQILDFFKARTGPDNIMRPLLE
jgi:hypothetical protein